ncbi:MAG: DUF4301 family protein [Cyclobacteriaceae bacterium]
MFSASDLAQIKQHQLTTDLIDYQLDKFKNGFPPTSLFAPSLENSGLQKLNEAEIESILADYDHLTKGHDLLKFVPASGAATRMFKSLFSFMSDYSGTDEDYEKMIADQSSGSIFTFFKNLEKFAFYEDLKSAYSGPDSLEEAHVKREYIKILETLLSEKGLDYGSLPKGLLRFHKYENENRTPVEEHIVEGAQYAKQADGTVQLHFTVSPDHMEKFKSHIEEVRGKYESKYDVKLSVSYSIQKSSTDTIAVDMDNEPFRNEDGSILFRPAGHGALLENLNDISADVVFIKNIDNVVPDHMKAETIKYKKVIGGLLLKYKEQIHEMYHSLEKDGDLEAAVQLLEKVGLKPSDSYASMSDEEKRTYLKSKLNRPIRVCGMVKSEGDPGGGPFWVKSEDGSITLQIVETAQIDLTDENQKKVFNEATHFNPADIVCYLKDVEGNEFDLMNYRDPDTGFVTKKSKDGQDLKAQELPGLWNGSMADWNTVFVEIPVITFNPVKSVNDLLKPEHS